MRTILAAFVGGMLAIFAMRALDRYWDGHSSAALAAARLLQRAELDLQCMTEKFEERILALRPPPETPSAPPPSLARSAAPVEPAAEADASDVRSQASSTQLAAAATWDNPLRVHLPATLANDQTGAGTDEDASLCRATDALKRLGRRIDNR